MDDSELGEQQLTMFDAMKLLDFTEDRLFVSSLDVAERFDKQHNSVLRSIETLECSEEFRAHNFARSSYKTSQNKASPFFKLTRDGCDNAGADTFIKPQIQNKKG